MFHYSVFILLGGHTTEMLKLVAELSNQYQPRHYVVADTDAMSTDKLHAMERNRVQSKGESLVCFLEYTVAVLYFIVLVITSLGL